MKKVSAIVLAAGRSSRMGAFKPLLPFGPQTVIESSIANLQKGGAGEVVVVVGHRGEEIREALKSSGVSFVINPDADTPMGVSIAVGVARLGKPCDAVLISPADHPAIHADTIRSIVDEWLSGASLVQPEYNGRGGHPVLIDQKYFGELLHLDAGQGLRGFFERHRQETRRLPVGSPFIARDMDTWEDYVSLHQDVFGVRPAQC